jgi:hypothetical protein
MAMPDASRLWPRQSKRQAAQSNDSADLNLIIAKQIPNHVRLVSYPLKTIEEQIIGNPVMPI